MDVTDLDLDLPSLKREVTVRSLKEQPAEIQKMILEKLSLMDQVRAAAELALKHNRWTAVLLVNDINAVRLYSKFTADDAISDVIFAQREFRYEVVYCNLDSRTAAELKDIATHSLEWNMGVDRPSNDSKQKLGLPLHNSQAWPLLLARVQNDAMLSLQCTELRKKDDMVRYLASNRPQCLLDVIVDLIGAQSNTDFAFAPYDILCTCCLLSKFATPTASVYRLGCGGKICKDCLGPELERRYIPLAQLRRFMVNNEFSQNGMVNSWKNLSYSNLTATGERTEKHTLILREHASLLTQERFGRNFDDVMYLMDNGKVLRDVRK